MIKQLQRLILAAVLCMPWVMQAQSDTLTVADGTATNDYVPIYGLWCDEIQQNQMLYPASMLADLTGDAITSLTYYMSSTSSSSWGTTVTIKMTEVSNSSLNSLTPTSNATVVWTGTVNGQNLVEEFVLSTPYIYMGGNLLIEFNTTAATWSSATWYGISHSGGSAYSYGSSSGTQDFLPKVKFVYQPADGICMTPGNLSATTSGQDATVNWTAGDGTEWEIAWGAPGFNPDNETVNIDNVSTNTYTISNLTDGLYQVYVRTVCDTNNSNWVSTEFMVGGCSITIVGADSYGDGWNGGSLAIMQGGATVGTFTLSGGSSGTASYMVAANMPVSFVWSSGSYVDEVSFEIYNFGNVLLFSDNAPNDGTVFTLNNPCSDCFAPDGVHVDSLTSDYARLVWSGTAGNYGVEWGESVDVAAGNGTTSTETDNYLELTNLTAGTGYIVKLWTNCDGGETSDTTTFFFSTIGEAISDFPYTTGFEIGDDMAWSFENDGTNMWTIGTGAAHTGSNALYITNDNGVTNAYTVSGVQFSYAYRPLTITDDGQYSVSFDWRAYGESNYDYLRAWIAPSFATFNAGHAPDGTTSAYSYTTTTPAGWIDLGGKMNLHNSWQTTTATPSLTAGSYFMVFMWANDGSGGSQPPAAIDNIDFRELSCPQPTDLTAVPHSHEVDLSWTAGGDESAWEIIVSDSIVLYSSSENYTVQGLDAYTYYHFSVRAICGDGDTSFATTSGNVRTLMACPQPTALTVDSVNMTEIFVSWVAGEDESSWTVTINDSVCDDATDTTYYFSNLNPNTAYTITVRALCDGNDTSLTTTVSTHTLAGEPINQFPYICGFEIDANNENEAAAWILENGSENNYWMVGSSTNNGGSNSLYITEDGTANSYYTSSSSTVFAYAVFYFNAGEYSFSYDWKADGESSYDYLRAAVVPNTVEFTAGSLSGFNNTSGVPTGGIAIDGAYRLNQQSNWQTQSGVFAIPSNGAYKVVFMWRNDGSAGTQPPAAIDNIHIEQLTCPAPVAFGIDTIEAMQATLDWTPVGEESEWAIRAISQTYTDVWQPVYAHPYTYIGLNSGTSYTFQLRAVCGAGDTSIMVSCAGNTVISCPSPTDFAVVVSGDTANFTWNNPTGSNWQLAYGSIGFSPDTALYIEYPTTTSFQMTALDTGIFEAYIRTDCGDGDYSAWVGPVTVNTMPHYNMASSGSDTLYTCNMTIYDSGGSDGNYGNSSDSYLYVYPVDQDHVVQISGYSYTEGSWDYLRITDLATGEVVFCDNNSPNGQTIPIHTALAGVELYFHSDGSVNYAGFEVNVSCVDAPNCLPISNLHVAGNTYNTVTLDWTNTNSNDNSWIVSYSTTPLNDPMMGNATAVTSHPYTVGGLTAGTDYYFYVRKDCGSGDSSTWSMVGPVRPGVWTMRANMTDTVYMCGGTIYDDGGSTADYSGSQNSCIILYPDTLNSLVSVSGTSYTEGSYDYLTIYDGVGTSGTVLWTDNGVTSNQTFGPITSTTGPLTITFVSDYSLQYSGFEINVSCSEIPSCMPVSNLHITGSTSSTVTLDWGSYDANDNSWVVSYSTTQLDNPMSGNPAAVTSHPYTVNGLTPGTDYYFYVLNDCGGGDSSTWTMVGPVRPGTWNMRPNQTDTVYMCGGVIYDDGGSTDNYSNNQSSTVIIRPDQPNTLVSISGTSYTEGSFDYLTIYDGIGTSGTVLWTDNGVSSNQTFGPIESTNGPLTIAFHSDGSVNYSGFEINVSCVSTACRVMNLMLNPAVLLSSSQLSLVWDAVTDAQSYEIEYGEAGFVLGQGQTMTSSTNSAVISGLNTLTSYDFYVRSICSGNEAGSWAHITAQTAMCDNAVEVYNYSASQGEGTSNHFPIGYSYYNYSYVQTIIPASQLADLTGEVTAFAFNVASMASGSSEFQNMTMWMANVSEDDLSSGFIMPDATSHVFTKVVDSADFSFSETGWQVFSLDSAFSWDGVSNVLVAVNRENGEYASAPSFAAHNDTVARARYVYTDSYAYDHTTVSGGYSATTIGDIKLISCGVGCARPSGVYATDVNYGSAVLHWSGNGESYEIAVKPSTTGTWPEPTAVGNVNTYTVSGLIPSTQYQFRVRTICSAAEGLISDWSVGTFTTDELPCFAPTDLHTTDISTTTVTLGWNAAANQTQWGIMVWNTAGGDEYNANSNPFTVTGLASNTTYFATVKTICGDGAAESEYGDTIQFTTGSCPQVTGVSVNGITSHTAVVSWSSAEVDSYIVEYGDRNFSQGGGTTVTVENATTYTITDLESDWSYTVFVRAVCEGGVTGDWSEQVDFDTPDGDGVNTVEGTMNLSIYPNPTSDATTIAVSGASGEVRIAIVDMNGRTVKSEVMSCDGDCTKRLEVSGLAQGTYFVRVNGEGVDQVKKLVIK